MTSVPKAALISARPGTVVLALVLSIWGCGSDGTAPPTIEPPPAPTGEVARQLPTLAIDVAGGVSVTSKDVYLGATYRLTDSVGAVLREGALEIKGRGNSTWDLFPKKPYRLKLGASAPLLSMPACRHGVHQANYSDKSLTPNEEVFEQIRMLGLE